MPLKERALMLPLKERAFGVPLEERALQRLPECHRSGWQRELPLEQRTLSLPLEQRTLLLQEMQASGEVPRQWRACSVPPLRRRALGGR